MILLVNNVVVFIAPLQGLLPHIHHIAIVLALQYALHEMTLSLFEWSFFNNTVFEGIIITAGSLELQNKGGHIGRNTPCCPPFLYAKIAAAAKAVAATEGM